MTRTGNLCWTRLTSSVPFHWCALQWGKINSILDLVYTCEANANARANADANDVHTSDANISKLLFASAVSLLELSRGGMELMEPVFLLDCLCVCVVLVHTSEMQTQAQMKGHICVTVVHTSISWSLRLRYGGSHVYFLAFAFAEQVWTEHNSPTIIFRSLSRLCHKLKMTSLSSKISFNFTS